MTKKNKFTACMIAIMIMLFSLPANAQGTVGYAELNGSTLTFKGGEKPEGAFALNTGVNNPGWNGVQNCTTVVFDESFKDVRPTSCYKWFAGFSQLTTIEGIENLNTEEVTNMSYMFYYCSRLTSLNLSSFNTVKVTNMNFMFYECSKLTSLNLSSFNTANVTSMSYMFGGCSGLTSLNLSSFNTDKVTGMRYMFRGCSGLTSLNLSSFSTAKVTDMYRMFSGCPTLTSLDLSSFNTAEVTRMGDMFGGCSSLTTIYVSDDFTTDNVSSSSDMFLGCTNLVGAASYDPDKTDKSMANYTTGYFTKGTTAIDLLNSVATDDAEYYDINGRRIDAPTKGVNIVRRGNKTIKLIIK